MYDIIIIGAGPAGLSAAITAKSKKLDTKVLILERQNKCGRKLSASGNGKCNVSNELFDEHCYHSNDRDFVKNYIGTHSYQEIIRFFEWCGIPLYKNNGYYYPLSNHAKQVTSKLIELCGRLGIEIITDKEVVSVCSIREKAQSEDSGILSQYTDNIKAENNGYYVITSDEKYYGSDVIIATGSNAAKMLGGSESGYKLVNRLGLNVTSLSPGLSPIYVKDDKLSIAKGVRLNGTITLHINDFVKKESGQIQINENNFSGIAMMNLSCYLPSFNTVQYENALWLDVMPSFTWDELKEYMRLQCINQKKETIRIMLEGFLPSLFVKYFLSHLSIRDDLRLEQLSEKQLNRITSNIKKLTFTPILQTEYEKAQVTLGGVSTNEINPESFECNRYPGLYVVGELLDMTGKCGGYNITFAVLSGISAAQNIIR